MYTDISLRVTTVCNKKLKKLWIFSATIWKLDECLKTGNATCECNLNKGFCGEDPKTCEKWKGNVTDLTKGVGLTQSCKFFLFLA